MFLVDKSEAEQKFWRTPELIEGLLPYLDPSSTLRLAQAHQITRDILQGSRVWNKVIKRCSPLNDSRLDKMTHLVAILKLMKDTKDNMLDLLDAICKANPSHIDIGGEWVQMGCPRHPGAHLISRKGFEFLEKVEAAFGTTEQTVEAISLVVIFWDGALMSALASRLSRQQQKPTSVDIEGIVMSSEVMSNEAADFKILKQSCPLMAIHPSTLDVDYLGAEELGLMAEGLESHPGLLSIVLVQKVALESGRREDLRILWVALKPSGVLHACAVPVGRGFSC